MPRRKREHRLDVLMVKVKPSGRKEFRWARSGDVDKLKGKFWRKVETDIERQEAEEWFTAEKNKTTRSRSKHHRFGRGE